MRAFSGESRVLLRLEERLVPTAVDDIVRFEAEEGSVHAVLAPAHAPRRVSIRSSLQALEESLGSGFVRLQRGQLVNVSWISAFAPLGDGRYEAVLVDGTRVVVSRSVSIELRRAAL